MKKAVSRAAIAHAQRVRALKGELAALLEEKDRLAAQSRAIAASEAALSGENKELVARLALLESSRMEPPCWEDLIGDSPPQVRDVIFWP